MDVNKDFVKIQKKKYFFFGGGGSGRGAGGGVGLGGQGRCEQRSEVFVKNKKKCGGVQIGGGGEGGVRVDLNEELKFL